MPLDLYGMELSPPTRTVRLTAKHLGVDLKFKLCDVFKGEHKSASFEKINVCKKIPALVDEDYSLGESRAIVCYLANAYAPDSPLYPKNDFQARAKINAMLYFDQGTLFSRFGEYVFPAAFGGSALDEQKKGKLAEALEVLSTILKNQKYVCGSDLTIADHSICVSISAIDESGVTDLSQYPAIIEWFARCRDEIPEYEELNGKPGRELGEFMKSKLKEGLSN